MEIIKDVILCGMFMVFMFLMYDTAFCRGDLMKSIFGRKGKPKNKDKFKVVDKEHYNKKHTVMLSLKKMFCACYYYQILVYLYDKDGELSYNVEEKWSELINKEDDVKELEMVRAKYLSIMYKIANELVEHKDDEEYKDIFEQYVTKYNIEVHN